METPMQPKFLKRILLAAILSIAVNTAIGAKEEHGHMFATDEELHQYDRNVDLVEKLSNRNMSYDAAYSNRDAIHDIDPKQLDAFCKELLHYDLMGKRSNQGYDEGRSLFYYSLLDVRYLPNDRIPTDRLREKRNMLNHNKYGLDPDEQNAIDQALVQADSTGGKDGIPMREYVDAKLNKRPLPLWKRPDAKAEAAAQKVLLTMQIVTPAFNNNTSTQGADGFVPSDKEIVSSIIFYWKNSSDNQIKRQVNYDISTINDAIKDKQGGITDDKQKLEHINPEECPRVAADSCLSFSKENWCVDGRIEDCVNRAEVDMKFLTLDIIGKERIIQVKKREIVDLISKAQSDLALNDQHIQSLTNNIIFYVVSCKNYEGNFICYVNLRTKGTDDVKQIKITMRNSSNNWIITRYADVIE